MNRHIAYRRVSTTGKDQKTDRQLFDVGIEFDKEFEDHQSGSSALKRVQFQEMLKFVQKGDTIHVQSNDRCFRNTKEMLGFVEDMMDKQVTVKLHTENLEFDAHGDPYKIAMSKLVLTNMASVSEFFLAQHKAAVKQGMAKAKQSGVKFGAANEKWQAKNITMNTKRSSKAKSSAERYRQTLTAILAALPKPTYRGIAEALTQASVELPSGIVGEWKSSQARRIVDRLEISIY
jgi:DNA invertase Pin-like site-specific DNA recombinase